ncbi:hypothetical protein BJ965_006461 [Streptomyces luteogriseus]|uniref:Uncharacterized protein n=1 Tax=Streptomyces luteogriseus TaxID=68233 RepID=A0A7W7DUQ4_9ACTN|nr:hypothetical protein [Streptomyces luteogriseus]
MWRGWAALLADGLAEEPAGFTNLAVSGSQTGKCWNGGCPPRWTRSPTSCPSARLDLRASAAVSAALSATPTGQR